MRKRVRKTEVAIRTAILEVLRLQRRDLLLLSAGRIHHAESTAAPADLPLATDAATAAARLNALRDVFVLHIESRCDADTGFGAHIETDTSAPIEPPATDESSAIALANEMKSLYVAHTMNDDVHPVVDTRHSITSPDATDAASLLVLVNELYTTVPAHFAASLRHPALELVAP